MYCYPTFIKMRDTDAAQVVFFAHYYAIAHEAYESAFAHYHSPLSSWINHQVHIPIIHSQAHHRAPLHLADPVTVCVFIHRIGTKSFTLHYELYKEHFQQQPTTQAVTALQTVHVTVENKSSVALPSSLIEVLQKIKTHHPSQCMPQLSHVFTSATRT